METTRSRGPAGHNNDEAVPVAMDSEREKWGGKPQLRVRVCARVTTAAEWDGKIMSQPQKGWNSITADETHPGCVAVPSQDPDSGERVALELWRKWGE